MPQENDDCLIWTPSTVEQGEFLAASEYEVLYGGRAGCGKTDGLLIDALGLPYEAVNKRDYQALILRRTAPDLRDIIDRSHALYEDFDPQCSFNKQDKVWAFPSGARIEFGQIQYDVDRFRYRGRAFNYIGWEELTLWPTDVPYVYLMSRLRSVDPSIPTFCRSTTNPDGPGHEWVKKRWQIQNNGGPALHTYRFKHPESGNEILRTRRFIPATHFVPQIGDEYVANLMLLDEDSQNALLRGRWDTPKLKGAYYSKDIEKLIAEGRLTRVPHHQGVPVNTFWDLGVNDTTAIWCHQDVAMQDRFINCYENNGESLSHYAKWLKDQPYVYGVHYLPHDAEHRKLGKDDTKSAKEMLEELLPGHTFVVVPRIDDVTTGIQQTRDRFGNCWFDDELCKEGFAALTNYRKQWNEQQQVYRGNPLHDWTSNFSDAFRQFGQGYERRRVRKSDGTGKTKRNWRVV